MHFKMGFGATAKPFKRMGAIFAMPAVPGYQIEFCFLNYIKSVLWYPGTRLVSNLTLSTVD